MLTSPRQDKAARHSTVSWTVPGSLSFPHCRNYNLWWLFLSLIHISLRGDAHDFLWKLSASQTEISAGIMSFDIIPCQQNPCPEKHMKSANPTHSRLLYTATDQAAHGGRFTVTVKINITAFLMFIFCSKTIQKPFKNLLHN